MAALVWKLISPLTTHTAVVPLEETKTNLLDALEIILATRREIAEEEIGNKPVIREPLRFVA